MFTETQQKVIRAVSTVLFEEVVYGKKPLTRAFKRTENTHEDCQKGHYFELGELEKTRYCLYTIDIDNAEYLGLDEFIYNEEYGTLEEVRTLGYVRLGPPDSDQWEMWRYCTAIERILELGC